MKLSTVMMFFLLIAGVIFIFSQAINEANTQYPEANINASAWKGSKYDFSGSIDNNLEPLKKRFETITDPDVGFFTKIGAGIIAIPYAVVLFPGLMLSVIGIGGNISTSLLSDIGVPGQLILIITIGILIWGIMELVKFFQRTPT